MKQIYLANTRMNFILYSLYTVETSTFTRQCGNTSKGGGKYQAYSSFLYSPGNSERIIKIGLYLPKLW